MIAHATYEMPDLEPQIDYSYNANGDWTEARTVFTQFQNVVPNNIEQFRTVDHQVIVWPDKYKTGKMIYPYADAKK
jgi:branched-chain amino acid transport system substrate-binding protein